MTVHRNDGRSLRRDLLLIACLAGGCVRSGTDSLVVSSIAVEPDPLASGQTAAVATVVVENQRTGRWLVIGMQLAVQRTAGAVRATPQALIVDLMSFV